MEMHGEKRGGGIKWEQETDIAVRRERGVEMKEAAVCLTSLLSRGQMYCRFGLLST